MKNYIHRQDIIYLCLAILVFFVCAKWGEIETVDKPVDTVSTVSVTPTPTQPSTQMPEPTKPPYLRDDVPLSEELQTALYEACMEAGIEYEVGLGLIEAESGFKSDAVSSCGGVRIVPTESSVFPGWSI